MSVNYYYTSVSGNKEIKKQQQHIEMWLDGKKIQYNKIDIAQSEEAKTKMRELMGDPKGLPPQLFNGDTYLGDYSALNDAVEAENIEEFLKI